MRPELITSIIIALIASAVPGIIAMRQARTAGRATVRLETKKVDAEAYDRAREMYESSITQLESIVTRQAAEVTHLVAAIARCERAVELSRQVSNQLRSRVYVLEQLIRTLGGVVPPTPPVPPIDLDRP